MEFNDRRYEKRMNTSGVKNKWIKAFRTLKLVTNPGDRSEGSERESTSWRTGFPIGQHAFQENTYKKITACDVCREILRGHSRQGLKCKLCKMNVHSGHCQENAPKCQPKTRLLRKQKSASELDTRLNNADIEDREQMVEQTVEPMYPTVRTASEPRLKPTLEFSLESASAENPPDITTRRPIPPVITHEKSSAPHSRSRSNASSSGSSPSYLLAVKTPLHAYSAPHSPQRKKLSLRMKSLSLDSPESTEHVLNRKHQVPHHMPQYNQSPQSPVHSRRFLFGKQNRMCSVDLPDTNEKSSASPSPCPSPKPQRLLPTNIFVVLYNFRSRHQDELDLKAGYSVTVVDTSDPDWWQGKCLGRKGYFPSNYVTKLFPGEKPLQVCHTIQVNDGEIGIKLLREQIVIQVVEEVDGIIMIRTGINDKIVPCPIKYLQDI